MQHLRLRIASTLPTLPRRAASTMTIETSKLSVLHGPLQPNTRPGDASHPTGFYRDGYCWGESDDRGRHYVAGVVTKEFLEFSKDQGNDLSSPRPGFDGLKEGCRWCLCVERWKEALMASERLGPRVVPKVDLAATAMDTLRWIHMDDLLRFQWRPEDEATAAEQREENGNTGNGNGNGNEDGPTEGGNWAYRRGYGFRGFMR